MLVAGCCMFLTPPPFDHTKLMLVDEAWVFVDSANWYPRSLRLNFEFNVECYDESLAERLYSATDEKSRVAKALTLAQLRKRTLPIQLRDGVMRLFSPYLKGFIVTGASRGIGIATAEQSGAPASTASTARTFSVASPRPCCGNAQCRC
jgi:hypothetical protein